jgi:hypothetical protein
MSAAEAKFEPNSKPKNAIENFFIGTTQNCYLQAPLTMISENA